MNLITFVGLLAATCTTISFLPQAIKTIRTKETSGLSAGMYIVLNIGILSWLIYGIFIKDIPVILANAVTIVFTFTILFLIFKYKKS